MRAGQAFLAAAVALGLCLALASRAAAKTPFTLTGASLSETFDTISGDYVDCPDYPAASDSYVWTAGLTGITVDLKKDFTDQPAIVAFVSDSCTPLTATKVTNTLEIPPGLATIKTKSGVVTITFSGSLPDFNTINTAATPEVSFFDYMTFELQYATATSTGTLQVSGNANLCDARTATAGPPQLQQCLALYTVSGSSCTCTTASLYTLDITSLFE